MSSQDLRKELLAFYLVLPQLEMVGTQSFSSVARYQNIRRACPNNGVIGLRTTGLMDGYEERGAEEPADVDQVSQTSRARWV